MSRERGAGYSGVMRLLRVLLLLGGVALGQLAQAAPGTVLFSDDFERNTLGSDWSTTSTSRSGISTQTSNSGTRSLFTCCGSVSVTSRAIDLSAVPAAQVSYWVRVGDDIINHFSEYPDLPGEDLVIEYLDSSSNWVTLDHYVGGATGPGEIFTPTHTLPLAALHAGFQLRIRQTGGSGNGYDYYHIDDVVITEQAATPPVVGAFCDDFESGLGGWSVAGSGDVGIGSTFYQSPTHSMYLRWDTVTATSIAHDISGVNGFITYWAKRGQDVPSGGSEFPDNNENLVVEYYNNAGLWRTLATYPGGTNPGEVFNGTFPIPADARHANFRLRFGLTQGSGNNYDYWHVDDVCVAPATPVAPYAYYAMDESAWTGQAGEVSDGSGNGHDASRVGTADTVDPGKVCRGADIPANGLATTDAVNTGIDINSIGQQGTITFWYKSNTAWDAGGNTNDRTLLDASTTNRWFWLVLRSDGRLRFEIENSSGNNHNAQTGGYSTAAGTWVHIAISWDFASHFLRIYRDGVLVDSSSNNNITAGNYSTLYIGDNRTGTEMDQNRGNSANGVIDEVRIHNSALTEGQVQLDMLATHPCGSTLDHFHITHDGFGINCVDEPISVAAVASNGTPFDATGTAIVLNTQSGKGSWALASGTGSFADAVANDGLATYTFGTGESSATFNLSYPEGASPINIAVSSGIIADDNTEGLLYFSPSGFVVTDSAVVDPTLLDTTITAKTAGAAFPLHLTAYGQTPTDPTCGIIESYTGDKTLRFWTSYNDPAYTTTAPIRLTVNGNAIDKVEDETATDHAVTFTNGEAVISAKYKDVGRIGLNVKDITVTDATQLPTGIRGASNLFVVKPAGFVLSNIIKPTTAGDCSAGTALSPSPVDATGTPIIGAGTPFCVTVTARDAEGATTPSYGQEAVGESVKLTPALVAAGGSNTPAIQFTTGFSFTDGIGSGSDFSWSEVGIIKLTPSIGDGNYLGAGDVTGTTSGNVGRFVPDHFTVAPSNGVLAPACNGFSYTGQPIRYLTGNRPSYLITAEAKAVSGVATTTQNYTGSFMRLQSGGVTVDSVTSDTTQLGADGTTKTALVRTAGTASLTDHGNGTVTYTFGDDSFAYTKNANALIAPYTSAIALTVSAIQDQDSVIASGLPLSANPSGVEVRYGRLALQNNHGSELLDLQVPMLAQYYNGSYFATNTLDSCSSGITLGLADVEGTLASVTCAWDSAGASGIGCTGTVPAGENYAEPPLSSDGGNFNLWLRATGAGNTGTVQVSTTALPSWLTYDWTGSGASGPTALATFGVFKGSPRQIYLREQY